MGKDDTEKKLTREQERAYLEKGGNVCPFCGSKNIAGFGEFQSDSDWASHQVECHDCGECWTDSYRLVGILEAEDAPENPFTILYVADGHLYQVGPFKSEEEAVAWAKEHNGTGPDSEFDINCQHVHLMRPDHTMNELSADDLK